MTFNVVNNKQNEVWMKVIKPMLIRREAANQICLFISSQPFLSLPILHHHPLSLLSHLVFHFANNFFVAGLAHKCYVCAPDSAKEEDIAQVCSLS